MIIGDLGQELAGTEVRHQPFQVAQRVRAPGMVLADLLPVAAGRDARGLLEPDVQLVCLAFGRGDDPPAPERMRW